MKNHALPMLWCAASAVWLMPVGGAVPTVAYDLDRAYSWKLRASDGLKAEYLMSLGTTAVPP